MFKHIHNYQIPMIHLSYRSTILGSHLWSKKKIMAAPNPAITFTFHTSKRRQGKDYKSQRIKLISKTSVSKFFIMLLFFI